MTIMSGSEQRAKKKTSGYVSYITHL